MVYRPFFLFPRKRKMGNNDGITKDVLVALDSDARAMRCDEIHETGHLTLAVTLKNHSEFGRELAECIKDDYNHVMNFTLNTGDSFKATAGLLVMDMWGNWMSLLSAEGIPLFSYDFSAWRKKAKKFLYIEKASFLPDPEITYNFKMESPSKNFVIIPRGSEECDFTKGIVLQSLI